VICKLLSLIGVSFVTIVPIIYLVTQYKIPFSWFLLGAAAWGLGISIKGSGWSLPPLILEERLERISAWNTVVAAGCAGLWSGVAELSTTALVLHFYRPQSFLELLAFGLGVGTIEVAFILLFPDPLQQERVRKRFLRALVLWSVLERVYATAFHITTRFLIYLSLIYTDPVPALIAIAGFTLLDGTAHYGELQKWDWTDCTLGLFHAWGIMVTVAMIWLSWILAL
jgi:hypothetical protein